jgi:sRNA-binding carbon storage regulator CsrA
VHREEIYHRICDTLKQFGDDGSVLKKETLDVSVVVRKEAADA